MTRGRLIAILLAVLLLAGMVMLATYESCSGCLGDASVSQGNGGANVTKAVKGGSGAKRAENPEPSKANEDDEPAPTKANEDDSQPVHCDCYNRCRESGGSSADCADECCGYEPSGGGGAKRVTTTGGGAKVTTTGGGSASGGGQGACLSKVNAHGRALGRLPSSLRFSTGGVQVSGDDAECYSHVVVYGPRNGSFTEPLQYLPLTKGRASISSRLLGRGYDRLSLVKRDGDQVEYWALLTPELEHVELVFEEGAGHAVKIPSRRQRR